MIIVCTRDETIRAWTQNPKSNSAAWDGVWGIPKQLDQDDATAALAQAISGLPPAAPLCLSAHGDDESIGDPVKGKPWEWKIPALAGILAGVKTRTGPLLISACAETVANVSAALAVALQNLGAQKGLWCYGYNIAVGSTTSYPSPDKLASSVELQGTLVG
jgi:hypothetical protein